MGSLCRSFAWRLVNSALVVCFGIAGGQRAHAQEDVFARQRDAEATATNDDRFFIAFADDRRSFHPGETIKLVFRFTRYDDVSPYNYEHCHGLGVAVAVLDHTDGTADPQADLFNNGVDTPSCGILSGVVGGIVPSGGQYVPRPLEFPVYLNQAYRFDRAGRYRLYIRSRHNFITYSRTERPPLISNILEFDIVDRDPAWEAKTLQDAIDALDSAGDTASRRDAARAISYLGTVAALEQMAQRSSPLRSGRPADRPVPVSTDWVRGFYGSADRSRVTARLELLLDQADRYISPRFVSLLSLLELTRRTDSRPVDRSSYESLVRAYSIRHLAALKAAGVLREDLAQTFAAVARTTVLPLGLYGLTAGFAVFPDDVEAAFSELKPGDQRNLLQATRNWTVFRDPAFTPMLRRLAVRGTREGAEDIALRLLYDLNQRDGRDVALRELAKRDSSIPISGFNMIPDGELPRLENTFVQMLERARSADEYQHAIDRIERFATRRVARRVRRAYERFKESRTCALAPAALAYFFRADPDYARTETGNVLKFVETDGCRDSVFAAVAERRVVPALEETAISYLRNPSGRAVADAARMLQEFGSARAEAQLWEAFERWHERWRDRPAELRAAQDDPGSVSSWDGSLERELSTALMEGAAWLMTDESARRLGSLCVSHACTEAIAQAFDHPEMVPNIIVFPSPLPAGEPTFVAHEKTLSRLPSRASLYRWISLHPSASAFTWQDWGFVRRELFLDETHWLPGESASLFEAARSMVERSGMTLTRRP